MKPRAYGDTYNSDDFGYPGVDAKGKPISFGPTLTVQASKDEVDVNHIVAKALKTGVLPTDGRQDQYLDLYDAVDYRAAIEIVRESEKQFMELPSDVRKKFDNDAAKFLEFAQDPKNSEAMIDMGLGSPEATEARKTQKKATSEGGSKEKQPEPKVPDGGKA